MGSRTVSTTRAAALAVALLVVAGGVAGCSDNTSDEVIARETYCSDLDALITTMSAGQEFSAQTSVDDVLAWSDETKAALDTAADSGEAVAAGAADEMQTAWSGVELVVEDLSGDSIGDAYEQLSTAALDMRSTIDAQKQEYCSGD
jgi:hypothetical protein